MAGRNGSQRRSAGADFSRPILIESEATEASDLKITFAWLGALRLPGLDLHRLDLVVDLIEPMLKLRGLYFHTNLAALADDMNLTGPFEFPHEDRVLEAALRARNVYGFVFKHFLTSHQPCKNTSTIGDFTTSPAPTYCNPPPSPNQSFVTS
ncbi:MAG: hypothetical protein WCA22_16535 [Candidatus Binatus sp.]